MSDETANPHIRAAMEKTTWQIVGWHAWREAVKARDALMYVEVTTEGLHRRVALREGPDDPRRDPDHYQLADAI